MFFSPCAKNRLHVNCPALRSEGVGEGIEFNAVTKDNEIQVWGWYSSTRGNRPILSAVAPRVAGWKNKNKMLAWAGGASASLSAPCRGAQRRGRGGEEGGGSDKRTGSFTECFRNFADVVRHLLFEYFSIARCLTAMPNEAFSFVVQLSLEREHAPLAGRRGWTIF